MSLVLNIVLVLLTERWTVSETNILYTEKRIIFQIKRKRKAISLKNQGYQR